jgi:hypothetical protein
MNMLSCSSQFFYHARLPLALAVFPIRADVFWPYFSGAIFLVIGLTKIIQDELPQKHGLDKFGRLFYALPMESSPHSILPIQNWSRVSFRRGCRGTLFGSIWWALQLLPQYRASSSRYMHGWRPHFWDACFYFSWF